MVPATQLTASRRDVARHLIDETERTLTATLEREVDHWYDSDRDAVSLVDALGAFVLRGGKRLRPAFAIWGHLGAEGDPACPRVVELAAALEMLHAFALLHDDVMDGSATRRGRPSVHAQFEREHLRDGGAGEARRFGEGMAVLTGDLALVLAERLMLAAPLAVRARWHDMQTELVRGQTLDMRASAQRCYDPALSRRIAVIKSGRYSVVQPLALGALNAGRPQLCGAYGAFGEPVGEAFQLRDDLMGAFGSTAETGKPVGDDLRQGKPTVLMAVALERACAADEAVLRMAGSSDCDDRMVERIQEVLDRCGARAVVESTLIRLADAALEQLDALPVDGEVRAALRDLAVAAIWRAT